MDLFLRGVMSWFSCVFLYFSIFLSTGNWFINHNISFVFIRRNIPNLLLDTRFLSTHTMQPAFKRFLASIFFFVSYISDDRSLFHSACWNHTPIRYSDRFTIFDNLLVDYFVWCLSSLAIENKSKKKKKEEEEKRCNNGETKR